MKKLTVDQALRKAATLGLQGRKAEAARLYSAVLQRFPQNERARKGLQGLRADAPGRLPQGDDAETHYRHGNEAMRQSRWEEALVSFDRAVALRPSLVGALNNRGNVLLRLLRPREALASYDAALQLEPDLPGALDNRGNALQQLGRLDDALASFDRAIALAPEVADFHNHRGNVLQELKRPDEALASFAEAVRLKPDFSAAAGQVLYLKAQLCDWAPPPFALDLDSLGLNGQPVPPFAMLQMDDHPARHLARARAWARARAPERGAPVPPMVAGRSKIRIGYFSADFYDHAVMYLAGKLFEIHDRDRFEIHAFGYGNRPHDRQRQRLVAGVDRFHPIDALSDGEAAALARREGIDIAVELTGYTRGGRSAIFAHRAAPIQMNWLGYAGTLGAEYVDYILVDRVVAPPGSERFFTEQLIRLPHSYMVTDDERAISARTFTRTEQGLPEDGFVFCSFNGSIKMSATEFEVWMRLLGRVDGSVLWLLEGNRWVRPNLRREAAARGIDPDRLVFAPRMPNPEHLARHRVADLFLDTFNCNAHTTSIDTLWAGLPILTKVGRSFAARVAASHLAALGLPELVAESAEAYEQTAFELATDRGRLAALTAKLAELRQSSPLFDTRLFARGIERAYELAYQRALAGLAPGHIDVTPA